MNNQSVLIKLLAISIGSIDIENVRLYLLLCGCSKKKERKKRFFYGSISFVMSDLRGNQAS